MTREEKRLKQVEILKEALRYYADKCNWSIVEDYDGFIAEGVIDCSDINSRPEDGDYGYGGIRARQALSEVAAIDMEMVAEYVAQVQADWMKNLQITAIHTDGTEEIITLNQEE